MLQNIRKQISIPYCKYTQKADFITKLLVVLICVMTVLVYNQSYNQGQDIEYPLTGNFEDYDPYVQQFDSFMKGRVSFDYAADESFMQLENPYDPQLREDESFLYDRAYYNGRYFSYFGTAPIFTVMYPYYFITGRIPSQGVIQTVYMLMFAVFFPLTVMNLGRKFSSEMKAPAAVLITYTAYVSSLNLLNGRGDDPFYYIAVTSAMAFLAMFGYLFLKGICAKRFRNRCIYFLAAGFAYALCFHSRINVAFGAVFFIIPAVIFGIILNKREHTKGRIPAELCSLAFFVIIGIAAALVYNYIRFDNPLEFGAAYQLTVADVSEYSLDITEVGKAIYCYYLAPISRSMIDDTLTFKREVPFEMDRYLYIDSYFGILSVPFMLFAVAIPFVCAGKSRTTAFRATLISAFAGTIVTAWVDFCLGGLIFRYLCDISVIMAVIASVCAFACADGIEAIKNVRIRRMVQIVMYAVLAAFLCRGIEITITNDYNLLKI